MKRDDQNAALLIQACFLSTTTNGILKGPKHLFMGPNGTASAWLNDKLSPFVEQIKLFGGLVEAMPGVLMRTQLGALIEETQKPDPIKQQIEHTFRIRFPVHQHTVDAYFTAKIDPETVNLRYKINESDTHDISAMAHETFMLERLVDASEAIKNRFYVDPDIYEQIKFWPGAYGENVVALPLKTAKSTYTSK